MQNLPTGALLRRFLIPISGSRFFIVSLAFHLVLICIFGSVALFKVAQREEAFIGAVGAETLLSEDSAEVESEPAGNFSEFEETVPPVSAEISAPSQSVVASLVQDSSWTTSASGDQANTATMLASFTPATMGTLRGVAGTRHGAGSGAKIGSVFGRQVRSSKLGVVFDVSLSTHKTIDSALQEIQKSFPDAVIVLAPGCGMLGEQNGERVKGQVIGGGEFLKNLPKYRFDEVKYHMGVFLPTLLERNRDFALMWNEGIQAGRMHVLHLDRVPKATALVSGTQLAFRFLADQGVDTIWWFADFEDEITEEMAQTTGRDLARRRIKVIEHDFDGGRQLEAPEKKMLSHLTGGEVIIGTEK